MKLNYSSLAAFLEHYRILERAAQVTADERERLAEMTKLLDLLAPSDREAIESDAPDAPGRPSERALRNLRRLLAERAILSG